MEDQSASKVMANKSPSKPILNVIDGYKEYNMGDLKRLVEIKYPRYAEFGKKLGWSRITVCSLLNSHWIPSDPTIIKKIADELGINEIKLTQLFARTEERK